ncbi:ATP-binding response regulator [Paenibacillus sp. CAA11]|uniref:ATP-binding response regulator n=1 Tax=Paenibacillus sp. CAA11 TaxID=1532905 RepID=UPI001F21AE62|nr:ATP-binding protein [Paenibacillus sp. CAA11]
MNQPHAVGGVLNLRGTDLENSPAFYVNGEWEFYPNELITRQEISQKQSESRTIQVPGGWGSELNQVPGNSYGYGTYRIRVLIDPLKEPVAFWFKGLQASSDIEINGEPMGGQGKVAPKDQGYKPSSSSYTASYDKVGTSEIELLVRAANFDSPYKGGIVTPVRFGSQASIDYVRWYSIGFQLFIFLVLLLHGIYACILYFFNPKERILLITMLLLLMISISTLINHDNVLLLWLPINYTWAIKIKLISLLWQNLLILMLFLKFIPSSSQQRWLRRYTWLVAAFTVLLMVVPVSLVNEIVHIYLFDLVNYLSFGWFLYLSGSIIFGKQLERGVSFLLVTSAGYCSNFIWGIAESSNDVTTVYYPIDLVVAITGFSSYWFKRYFQNSRENVELNHQLQKADKIKDEFLANTSHELQTPLHGIMNIAYNVVAKEKDKLQKSSLEEMQLLITISRRMSYLIGDLLDVVRLQEHRIQLQQSPLQVQSIVPGIIAMLQFMTDHKAVNLQMDIAETTPPVWADEKRLVQILYNLLHNALKYTEEGTISVSMELRQGQAYIHVADTGVGMDKATLERVFLPYEQGSYGLNDGQGIGLGLSICKQLVELHGGTLVAHSTLGEGSVFSFNLPLAGSDPASDSSSAPMVQEEVKAAKDDLGGLVYSTFSTGNMEAAAAAIPPLLEDGQARILAVDDDPINLKVLVSILSSEPYTVITAQSGGEALELLETQQWDLLIADVMMPNMSGYELTQRVREQYSMSELPVLLLTARSQPIDIYTGFSAGANDYVTKPVDALELKYRIAALVNMKQSMNERLRIEAAYLQAQIQPHFLFNTLNSLMALSDIDTESMRKLGEAFTSFLRISFDYLNTGELVDLSHELELVEAYLYIEKVRFGQRLSVVWDVEPDLRLLLPPLSIQPLVENAVKHGLLSKTKGGTVRLTITRQDGHILVEVSDNGKGMDPTQVARCLDPSLRGKGGIGLANTNRRIQQLYGQGLSIISSPGEGTTVSFVIPRKGTTE